MKTPPRLLAAAAAFLLSSALLPAEPNAVITTLRQPAPGVEPLVLFLGSPETNEGSGDARWIATSGTRLSARGRDPWGNEDGAFGPEANAATGAAIASSTESPLLTGDSGTLILCVQVPGLTGDPAMILSRGAWGDRAAFDLRADKSQEIILYCGGAPSKPDKLVLGRYMPGTWVFIGLSWQREGESLTLSTCVGDLAPGQSAQANSFAIPQAGEPSAPVLIGGRTNRDLAPALLEGGLFWGVAIYEQPLSPEGMEEIFRKMTEATKP